MKTEAGSEKARERLIVALDFGSEPEALDLVADLAGQVSWFKVGLQLFTAAGPGIVRAVQASGARVFLDLKLYDIPNTVAKAVAAAGELGAAMLTLHLSGGARMLAAAVAQRPDDLLLLGVTVLTSSDETTLRETGVEGGLVEQTVRLAQLGAAAGLGGLIASPHEVEVLREATRDKLMIITPGVRPSWSGADDQKRFTTPREALQKGADYLVIGRPITAHPDPREAVRKILDEMSG